MELTPINIAVSHSKGLLIIDWDDDHHSEYPLKGLRIACPCVECRGGHSKMGDGGTPALLEGELEPGASAELENLEIIGNYGLQIVWKDGHSYGIYTWGYLRQLCPCAS